MDFTSLLAGVDNLFKFLFIGGLAMLFTAMFYPLQKEQDLEIEINTYNKEVKLLNRDLDDLKMEVDKLNRSSKDVRIRLEALKNQSKSTSARIVLEHQIKDIKAEFKSNYDSLYKKKQTTEIKEIMLEFNNNKIIVLKKYSDDYSSYATQLKGWGICFIVTGLIGWVISTINVERLKLKEIKKP